eukprot:Seg1181.6 transcript_id=Seg1181.6/GoldUCD/mRNA.D3Y31 product="G2/M phase-specific E3 ubiquitin-protein ligase" protein_id=Seg1181.6/GoldUCD/D3Y31
MTWVPLRGQLIDLGGPRRELLTLLLQHLRNSSIFVGEEASKSLTSLAENDYFLAGRVIAMSLVHGAAAPKFFSSVLYEALFKDSRHIYVSVDAVPDRGVKEALTKLHDAADVDAANKVIDENDTLFSLAGTSCFVVNENEIKKMAEEVAHWYVLGRCNEHCSSSKMAWKVLACSIASDSSLCSLSPFCVTKMRSLYQRLSSAYS